jgi:hypothetical protein
MTCEDCGARIRTAYRQGTGRCHACHRQHRDL